MFCFIVARIIFLSSTADTAMEAAGALKATGVNLVTIGIGEDLNKEYLEKMASSPDVNFNSVNFADLDSIKPKVSHGAFGVVGKTMKSVIPQTSAVIRLRPT